MKLDGGVLNNNFMEPFLNKNVDKLYLVVLNNNFEIPKYILDKRDINDIIVIQRKSLFESNDSLNYNKEFLCSLFKEEYNLALEAINKKKLNLDYNF